MVGRSVETFYKKDKNTIGEVVMEVKNLKLRRHSPTIHFNLRKGEILGIAGLVGSGRTELVRALFGMDRKVSGEVLLRGKPVNIRSPQDSIRAGIGLITEDRHKTGLALNLSVIKNTTIAGLDQYPGGILNLNQEKKDVEHFILDLDIKTPSPHQEVRFLSGGNQQKVVLARWLFKNVDILIFDEPTIGIDVNSKNEIYKLITELAKEGKSIVMVSSELPELIALSDRVLVVKNGRIITELNDQEITEENIISYAFGVTDDGQSKE
jgi:ABC-type sugar transport system ATPase subunit